MKYPLTVALTVAIQLVFAQDKRIEFEKNGMAVYDPLNLGESGFALSYETARSKTAILKYYNIDLEPVWETTTESRKSDGIDQSSSYDTRGQFLIGTGSGSLIYYVQWIPAKIYSKPFYVTQVAKAGEVKKFTVNGRDDFGHTAQSVFCDEQYFYILASDEGDERSEKKKDTEKLILNRFDAKTFAYKRMVLDLPAVEEGDHTSFWAFAGQNAAEKILVSRNIDYENEKVTLNCIAIDQEGKQTRSWTMEPKLDGEFLRPARNVPDFNRPFHAVANFDYFMIGSKSQATGNTYIEPRLDYSNFCSFVYDEPTETFYVFGLMGPKQFRKIGPEYDGFYVFKYNSKGELQWKLQQQAPKTLSGNAKFRIHAMPHMRNITFRIGRDNSLNFAIQCWKMLGIFAISAEGKVVRTNFDDDYTDPSTDVYMSATPSKVESFVQKLASGKKRTMPYFVSFTYPDRDLLLVSPYPDPSQILMFKK